MSRIIAVSLCAFVLSACSVFGVRSGTEQAPYTVIAQLSEDTEVRRYPPVLAAEASVSARSEERGRNSAFRLLFDYISGANRTQTKVAMTTPVETAAKSQKIAMTIPVETPVRTPGQSRAAAGEENAMRFFLPAKYTVETAPEPTNPKVRLVEVPERTVAVRRFTGSTGAKEAARQRKELDSELSRSDWKASGEPFAMYYDPPWTLPFLRRNEVAVPVIKAETASDTPAATPGG